MDTLTQSLATLQTRLVDASKGYAEGAERSDDPTLVDLFGNLRAMHERHAAALSAVLAARGVEPDADGSFLQYVHKAVLNVRAAFGGLDRDAIPGVRDGEERILGLYDETLLEGAGEPEVDSLLERQREEVALAVKAMRTVETASGS